jgi:putative photosynthetic complex assembly protein
MSAVDAEPFPRAALIAAAAVLSLSIAFAAAARWTGFGSQSFGTPVSSAKPSLSEDLRFSDNANGSVSVRDGQTNALVATLAPGTEGFVRDVMRGLARERRMRGIGPAKPFRLTQWTTGQVYLEDLATGRRIDLQAFGPTNRAAFLRLLVHDGAKA